MKLSDALSIPEGPNRTAALVAWVQSLYQTGDRVPVLVGGGAVEIYTGGAYTTGDLDFVGSVPSYIQKELEANGFKKSGRHWINNEEEIFLEFPGDTLEPAETSIQYEAFGFELVMVSPEDLLVDRLGAWAYWKSGVDGANAYQLYRACRDAIDEERLTHSAREAGFEPALDALREFVLEWADSDPDAETLEKWANRGPKEGVT